MKLDIKKTVTIFPAFIQVSAWVRYWEDASVNGVEDTDGKLIPLRNGNLWEPIIDMRTGVIRNWPAGTISDVHYKVCDQGEYWLLDEAGQRIAKWEGHYVPDDILCPSKNGYGDYIILKIDTNGLINEWRQPSLEPDEWVAL